MEIKERIGKRNQIKNTNLLLFGCVVFSIIISAINYNFWLQLYYGVLLSFGLSIQMMFPQETDKEIIYNLTGHLKGLNGGEKK